MQLDNLLAERLKKEHVVRVVLMTSGGSETWQKFSDITAALGQTSQFTHYTQAPAHNTCKC